MNAPLIVAVTSSHSSVQRCPSGVPIPAWEVQMGFLLFEMGKLTPLYATEIGPDGESRLLSAAVVRPLDRKRLLPLITRGLVEYFSKLGGKVAA